MLCVGKPASHKGDLHVRIWILQQLEVFDRSSGFAPFQFDVRTRKYFSILTAIIFERSAFKRSRHDDFRRRRRNKINQGERSNAYDPDDRQCLENLPAREFHSTAPRVASYLCEILGSTKNVFHL